MSIEDTTKLLSQMTLGGTPADADYALRRRVQSVDAYLLGADIPAGPNFLAIPVLLGEDKIRKVTAIRMFPSAGLAIAANSNSYRPRYHDGAGGVGAWLAAIFDGTAVAVVAAQTYTFTLIADPTVPAGSVIEMVITENNAGRNDLHVVFEVEYEYV